MTTTTQADGFAPPESSRQSVAVVVPCYNESEVLSLFYARLAAVFDALHDIDASFVFVDDGSTDDTFAMLRELAAQDGRVRPYALSRNFGHQIALTAGLDVVSADAVILMDADLQHPPELIRDMIARRRQGYDVVSCVRRRTEGASRLKDLASRAFYWMINRLSATPVKPGAADFCLLSRQAQEALRRMPERHRFLRGMISWIGFRRGFLEFDAPQRAAGASKYTWRRMAGLALDAVLSFSARPMRLICRAGALAVIGALFYIVYAVIQVIRGATVRGWASTIAVLGLLGGIQLVAIGVIGEYIARLFDEAKQRPLYFFKDPSATRASPDRDVKAAIVRGETGCSREIS